MKIYIPLSSHAGALKLVENEPDNDEVIDEAQEWLAAYAPKEHKNEVKLWLGKILESNPKELSNIINRIKYHYGSFLKDFYLYNKFLPFDKRNIENADSLNDMKGAALEASKVGRLAFSENVRRNTFLSNILENADDLDPTFDALNTAFTNTLGKSADAHQYGSWLQQLLVDNPAYLVRMKPYYFRELFSGKYQQISSSKFVDSCFVQNQPKSLSVFIDADLLSGTDLSHICQEFFQSKLDPASWVDVAKSLYRQIKKKHPTAKWLKYLSNYIKPFLPKNGPLQAAQP